MGDFTFDGTNKLIIINSGITNISIRDLWSRWVDWALTSDNSKFLPAFKSVGADDIDLSQGTKIPVYSFLLNNWKLRPQEASHTLTVRDGILVVEGGGDPFTNTLGAYIVRINYQQPVQAISFSTGAGGGTSGPTKEEIRQEIDDNSIKTELIRKLATDIHKVLDLNKDYEVTRTKTSISVDDIEILITGDGENISISQRQ